MSAIVRADHPLPGSHMTRREAVGLHVRQVEAGAVVQVQLDARPLRQLAEHRKPVMRQTGLLSGDSDIHSQLPMDPLARRRPPVTGEGHGAEGGRRRGLIPYLHPSA